MIRNVYVSLVNRVIVWNVYFVRFLIGFGARFMFEK